MLEDLCFDAQQAAEKAIKAILIYRGIAFPYVHDLGTLLGLVAAGPEPVRAKLWRALAWLDGYSGGAQERSEAIPDGGPLPLDAEGAASKSRKIRSRRPESWPFKE